MSIELSAEALKARTELTDAQAGLDSVKGSLASVDTSLVEIDAQIGTIQGQQEKELGDLEEAKLKDILGVYDHRLQNVIALALGGEKSTIPKNPDLEACQKIAELDAVIKGSAGQPIVVINPAKPWVDFAILQEADPEHEIEAKGLVIASGPTVHSKNRIELPSYGALAIDPDSGELEIGSERELYAREHRIDGISSSIIDPLKTKAVLPGEKAEYYQEEDSDTTLILIGYDHLSDVLNDIFGFSSEPSTSEEDSEARKSFMRLDTIIKKLQKKGIEFDPDFIDGYLLHRISILEKTEEESAGKNEYKKQVLSGLWKKYEQLIESGWL